MDAHSWVLWLGVIAVGLHVMEEYVEGWTAWANRQVGPRFGVTFTQVDFLFAAFLLVFYALAAAAIGWWAPAVSLAVPALFIVNAIFLHMIPSARGDRLTPGTLSAVFIYLPVAAWMFWAAAEDGVLDFGTVVLAFVLGTALMLYPLAVAVLATKIGWQEDEASGSARSQATEAPESAHPSGDGQKADESEPGGPDSDTRGAAEPDTEPTTEADEPVIEVEGAPAETGTIVIESDNAEDDTRVLDRESGDSQPEPGEPQEDDLRRE